MRIFYLFNFAFFLHLQGMEIQCTEEEQTIFRKIAEAGAEMQIQVYVVGGFVRDKILGRANSDLDIVCVGDGIQLAHKVAGRFQPRPRVNFFKNFGTAHMYVDEWNIEFVGARKESYRSDSRNPEVAPGTLEEDQERRDFTINALAISLNPGDYGTLIDPFNGISDLHNKIIRTPLDPGITFSDDPLRMMRAIRFAATLNFSIDPATLEGIRKDASRIRIVSQERITDELNKILQAKKPSVGFDLLYRTGLLQIIFPQMVDLAGAEYRDGWGTRIISTILCRWLTTLRNNQTISGFAGPQYYTILESLPPKNSNPNMAGPSMGTKWWAPEWWPGSLQGSVCRKMKK